MISVVQGIGLVEAKDPDYPTKPITFYIPFSAGGTIDVVFAHFSKQLANTWGNRLFLLISHEVQVPLRQ